ncbi:MAG: MBOAT family protein, partial [Xanthomonadales bacterium]|nr:MBOAT family protein [Xanthomonadales bacterium]
MNFDSLLFFGFLAAVLALHGAARSARARKGVLLGSSYLFYGFWNPPFVLLLAFSTAVDWFAARGIHRRRRAGHPARWLLVASLVTNLGLLAYFKYSGFVLASLSDGLAAVGIVWNAPAWQVILPVGISFYTFQSISYTIDVWRGERAPADDWLDFALYVSFFAQLVAGPIVRAGELLPQLQQRTRTVLAEVPMAAWLIVFGLFLKGVLADSVFAPASDAAFAAGA